jgi:hypothetical protein
VHSLEIGKSTFVSDRAVVVAHCLFGLLSIMHGDEDTDGTERCCSERELGSSRHLTKIREIFEAKKKSNEQFGS